MRCQRAHVSNLLRILYIGTFPPPEGGVRLGVQTLAEELERHPCVEVDKVDISTDIGAIRRVGFYLRRFLYILRRGQQADVLSFCAPTKYAFAFGVPLYLISRLLRRPLVLRHTAGHNDQLYCESNAISKFIFRKTVLSAELNLYQTSSQVEFFKSLCSGEVLHFPNHRKMPVQAERRAARVARRFVFIGRLEAAKGADDLIEVFSTLGSDVSLDLYGDDNFGLGRQLSSSGNIRYRGTYQYNQVFTVLQQYDVLILPSLYEGQPGVIVESFLSGMPVIATRIPGIQDIVENGETGLLVTVKEKSELRAAIETLATQEAVYKRLSQNVWDGRHRFSSEFWGNVFFEKCVSLASKGVSNE